MTEYSPNKTGERPRKYTPWTLSVLQINSFPRATLSKNCSLLGKDNVRGQICEHISAPIGDTLEILDYRIIVLQPTGSCKTNVSPVISLAYKTLYYICRVFLRSFITIRFKRRRIQHCHTHRKRYQHHHADERELKYDAHHATQAQLEKS